MSNDVRALTELEARDQLVATAVNIADEYANDADLDAVEKCHGVAFSILAALDGKRDLPPMHIVAQTTDAVVKLSKEQGEPYIGLGTNLNPAYDLHTRYTTMRQEIAQEAAESNVEEDDDAMVANEDDVPF